MNLQKNTTGALLIAIAALFTCVSTPAQTNYTGGAAPTGIAANATIPIEAATSGAYTYSYADPTAASGTTTVSITYWKPSGGPVTSAFAIGANNGVTIQSATPGAWGILDTNFHNADSTNKTGGIITITEPAAGASATLTLNNIILADAYATKNGPAIAIATGGGGTVVIAGDIVVYNNTGTNSSNEGAVTDNGTGNLVFAGNVVFDSNKNGYTGAGANMNTNALGGAIYYTGANSMDSTNGSVLAFQKNATFINNYASGHGGAIYFSPTSGTMHFYANAIFEGNMVTDNPSAAGANAKTYVGGAIDLNGAGDSLIVDGTAIFINNKNTGNGGAIGTSSTGANSTINGDFQFNGDSYFIGNQAGYQPDGYDPAWAGAGQPYGNGGGINFGSGMTPSQVLFQGKAVFQNNTAFSIIVAGADSGGNGGAINAGATRQLVFNGEVLASGNMAYENGGAFNLSEQGLIIQNTTGATMAFLNNVAGAGVGLADNTGATTNWNGGSGGAIFGSSSPVIITAASSLVQFNNNAAASGTSGGLGGAIYTGNSVTITAAAIELNGNQASGNGGAIYIGSSTDASGNYPAYRLNLSGPATISDNIAGQDGGAIYSAAGVDAGTGNDTVNNIRISGSATFANNAARGNGGAIYATGASSTVTLDASAGNITFTGNKQGVILTGALNDTAASNNVTSGVLADIANGAAPADVGLKVTAGTGVANDIYFASAGSTLDLETAASTTVTLNGGLASADPSTAINVVKNGAGDVTFGAASINAIKTVTTVNAGAFRLAGASYGNGGSFTLAGAGASLAGKGTMLENVTANAGSAITVGNPGDTTAGTLNFGGDLILNGGVTLNFNLFDSASAYDQITVAGALTATGVNTIDFTGLSVSGTYTLIQFTGAGAFAAGSGYANFALSGVPAGATDTLGLDAGGNLILNFTAATVVNGTNTWTGSGTSWSNNNTGGMDSNFDNGNHVVFGQLATSSSIAITGNVAVTQMDVDSGNDYTFSGNGGVTASATVATGLAGATGKLVKSGSGSLNFTNAGGNTFEGGIDINAGVISFTDAAQLNTAGAAITFLGNGTLRAAANNLTLANAIDIASGATATIDTGANKLTLSGVITDDPATFAKIGAGVLNLTADNSGYTGATDIQQGTLNVSAGASLGGAVTIDKNATLAGAGSLTGSVSAAAGSIISIGDDSTAPAILTIANLNLDAAILQFNIFANNLGDQLNVANLTFTGAASANTIDVNSGFSGTFNLGNIAALSVATVTVDSQAQSAASRSDARVQASGADLLLIVGADMSRVMNWTGATNATWADVNWLASDGSGKTLFANGDRVVFNSTADAANTANRSITLAGNVLVSDMLVGGAGDYTFAGAGGITADAASVLPGAITDATGKLVKTGAGTLTFANTGANLFKGGIEINGGALAFNNAAQLDTTGANINFTGNSALLANANNMTLANAISIASGVAATINANGNTLNLSGALTGSGTLVATGNGTLNFTTAASLGNAATQIDSGAVVLGSAVSTAASSITHAFLFNGGTLNLSTSAYDATGATANNWSGLALQSGAGASTSVITGGNDQITLAQGGAFTPNITGGIFVVVNAGSGTVALTGANTYTGYTLIKSGVLQVSATNQLGATGAATRAIIFDAGNTGQLEVTDNMTTTRGFELRGNAAVSVDDGITTQWGVITEDASGLAFNKLGAGALVLTGTSAFTGQAVVQQGVLQINNASALGSSAIAIQDAATFATGSNMTLSNPITISGNATIATVATGTTTLTGAITGGLAKAAAGSLTKDGPGVLVLANAGNSYGDTNVIAGTLQAAAAQAIASGNVNVGANGTLKLEGFAHTFASLTNDGIVYVGPAAGPNLSVPFTPSTLTVTGDYRANGNSTLYLNVAVDSNQQLHSDLLHVGNIPAGQGANGVTSIMLNTGGQPNVLPPTTKIDVSQAVFVTADSGNVTDIFSGPGLQAGGLSYGFVDNGNGGLILTQTGLAPQTLATIGIDAATLFVGKAINESLSRRFAALRANDTETHSGINVWVNGLDRQDKVTSTVYDGAKCTTQGVQAGIDYLDYTADASFSFGGFYTYAQGDMKVPGGGRTQLDSSGVGVYGEANHGAWYVAAMVRINSDSYDISSTATIPFTLRGTSWGASIEGGYDFALATSGWKIEPQLQLSLHRSNVRNAYDNSGALDADGNPTKGYYYEIGDAQSTSARAGAKLFKAFTYAGDKLITPYLRVSVEHDLGNDNTVDVSVMRNGVETGTARGGANLGGTTLLLDAGMALQITKRFDFTADAAAYTGGKYQGYSLNAGLRLFW